MADDKDTIPADDDEPETPYKASKGGPDDEKDVGVGVGEDDDG